MAAARGWRPVHTAISRAAGRTTSSRYTSTSELMTDPSSPPGRGHAAHDRAYPRLDAQPGSTPVGRRRGCLLVVQEGHPREVLLVELERLVERDLMELDKGLQARQLGVADLGANDLGVGLARLVEVDADGRGDRDEHGRQAERLPDRGGTRQPEGPRRPGGEVLTAEGGAGGQSGGQSSADQSDHREPGVARSGTAEKRLDLSSLVLDLRQQQLFVTMLEHLVLLPCGVGVAPTAPDFQRGRDRASPRTIRKEPRKVTRAPDGSRPGESAAAPGGPPLPT